MNKSRLKINLTISLVEIADRFLKLDIMNYSGMVSCEKVFANDIIFIVFEKLISSKYIVKCKPLSRLVLRKNVSLMKTLKILHCSWTDVFFHNG